MTRQRRSWHMEPSASRGQEAGIELVMSPILWRNLPEELLERVYSKLPFESLVRLRRVCKRWNHLLLSGEISYLENPCARCVPVHFGRVFRANNSIWKDELVFRAYNSIRKDWLEHSLAFLGPNCLTSRLAATAGGLLCFSTNSRANLVICNPLTRKFKKLEIPEPAVGEASLPQLDSMDKVQLAMSANTTTGNYELLVAVTSHKKHSENAGILRGRVLGYDSVSKCWKQFANVPRDVLFWLGRSVFCNRSFYCLVAIDLLPHAETPWQWMLRKYDLDRDRESVYPAIGPCAWMDHARIVEHRGSILVVSKSSSNMSIHKLDESSSELWVHVRDFPPNIFRNFKEKTWYSYRHGIWWCASKGDLLFIVDPSRERFSGGLIVLVHDLSKNTWEWIPMLEGSYVPHHLCAFEPSLASP